jgi:AraC-like DNA-binding protein
MTKIRIAEPDYDFEVRQTLGKELIDKVFFSPELSIIKCTGGKAAILINSQPIDLGINEFLILSEGMLFKVTNCSDDFSITTCRFSIQFMNEVYANVDNTVVLVFFNIPVLRSELNLEELDLTFRQICILNQNKNHTYRHKLALNYVINFIYQMYELSYLQVESKAVKVSNYQNQLINSFFTMCYAEHTKHRNIEYYANKLNISSRYLYKKIKEACQLTPKQIIDYHIIGTTKIKLLTTSQTNQQIADELNFPDQGIFGQFFKRNVGMSPSEFRKIHK